MTHLFLNEVHRYPEWSQTLKNIYDNYPDLYLVYTGSSMLEIDNSKADLSRRQTVYEMWLQEVVSLVIDADLPSVEEIEYPMSRLRIYRILLGGR